MHQDPVVTSLDEEGATAGPSTQAASEAAHTGETHAVSVETIFAGTSIVTRLLPAACEETRAAAGPRFLAAGLALIVVALTIFAAASVRAADDRLALAAWTASGRPAATFPGNTRRGAPLDVLFGAALLGGGALASVGMHRRAADRRRFPRSFSIGTAAAVDAPVDPTYLAGSAGPDRAAATGAILHALVTASGEDYLIHPAPSMNGVIEVKGAAHPLADVIGVPGATFRLPPGARVRLACGRTTFVIRSIVRPARVGRPRPGLSAPELPYTLGAAVALSLLVLMIFTVPPDPRALSFDALTADGRLIAFNVAPPVFNDPTPPWARSGSDGGAAAPAGPAGGPAVREPERRRGQATRAASRAVKPLTEQESLARANDAGILGIFKASKEGPLADVMDGKSAFGDAAAVRDIFGNLVASAGPEATGWGGGLRGIGTGSGGGGTGEHTLGVGRLGTLGGPGHGPGYGRAAGGLRGRKSVAPDVIVADGHVKGVLDAEVIRRVIRRHINEIRYCYEEELRKQPHLSGRIGVQFTIGGAGKVLTSVLQSSTVANRGVENCTVNAVRRWEFPQPSGQGLTMVSYPFVFAPVE